MEKHLPEGMKKAIETLKRSGSREKCLKEAYGIMTKRFRGYRIRTYTRFFELFDNNLEHLWNKKGFLHCTKMNRLMRVLLVGSGFFSGRDIKSRWGLVYYISPHQHLEVAVRKGKSVSIDIWGNHYGIRYGDYAHGFN